MQAIMRAIIDIRSNQVYKCDPRLVKRVVILAKAAILERTRTGLNVIPDTL
jgi:hypothetical protein